MIEHRYLTERMARHVLGLARFALEYVHRHLFVTRTLPKNVFVIELELAPQSTARGPSERRRRCR